MRSFIRKAFSYYNNSNIAVKASIWFTVCSIIQKGISVLTMPVFTRLMSPEQFGQYNVYLTWYNILVLVVTLNVHSEIFNKGLSDHWEEKNDYTASRAGLLVFLGFFWSVLYIIFRNYLNKILGITTMLGLFMILEIVGTAIVGLWCAQKRFEYDYKKIVQITLSMAILNPIVGIVAVLSTDYKAEAKIIANAVIPTVFSIGILITIGRKSKLFVKRNWWKSAIVSGFPLVPHYLSLVLLNQSDKLMINYFSGPTDAAIYSVAHTAGLFLTIINNSVNGSFIPWAYEKIKNKNGEGIKETANSLLVMIALVNAALIWIAPEAIRLLAAPEYSEAAWCLAPVAMSVFFYFAYTLFVDIEIYYGENKFIAIASICAALLNICLNYIFIPKYGYITAGYTTLVSYIATMLLHLLFLTRILRKKSGISSFFDIKVLCIISILFIVVSASGIMLYHFSLIRFMIIIVSLIVLFSQRKRVLIRIKDIGKFNQR